MHYKKLWRSIGTGLTSLCLMTLLGCSMVPQGPLALPNEALYAQDIPEPPTPQPLTNGGLAALVVDLREALGIANADRAALREWAATMKGTK